MAIFTVFQVVVVLKQLFFSWKGEDTKESGITWSIRFYGFSLVSILKQVMVTFKQKTSPPSLIACYVTLHPALSVSPSVSPLVCPYLVYLSVCQSTIANEYYKLQKMTKNDLKVLANGKSLQKLANACTCLHMLAHACKYFQMLANDKKMTKNDKKWQKMA